MKQQTQKMNLIENQEKEEEYESMMNKDQQYLNTKKNWFRNQRLDEFLTEEEVMIVSNVLDTFDSLWNNMERTKMKYQDFHLQLKENERTLSNLNKELDEMENAFMMKTQMELMQQAQFQEERHRMLQQQKDALTMDFQLLTEQVKQQEKLIEENKLKELKEKEEKENEMKEIKENQRNEKEMIELHQENNNIINNNEKEKNVFENEKLEDIPDDDNK